MGEVRFMISEAAKQVEVESHVLRYWEEELGLTIGRTEMGHRYYTRDDIQLFCCIKKLKDEGMLLKDLKPLIPELKATRLRIKEAKETESVETPKPKSEIQNRVHGESQSKPAKPALSAQEAEVVIPIRQLDQVRSLLGEVLTEVVTENNEVLKKGISEAVTADVMQEMDRLMQSKERQQEEHFRKLDCLIRQQQASRKESMKISPILKLKKMFT